MTTDRRLETVYTVGRERKICPECKKEFFCYPGQHEWALSTTHAKSPESYIKSMLKYQTGAPGYRLLFCSYHCMRAEEKRRQEILKKKYDRLMWEAENCYDADGNLLKKKKYQKHKEVA